MKLNAPDLTCLYCSGKGARVRELRLVLNGLTLEKPSQVLLHCGCLSPNLKALHAALDKSGVLEQWPWDDLKDLRTPRAEGGPEPILVGNPLPAQLDLRGIPNLSSLPKPPPKPMEMPVSVPNPAKTKKRKAKG